MVTMARCENFYNSGRHLANISPSDTSAYVSPDVLSYITEGLINVICDRNIEYQLRSDAIEALHKIGAFSALEEVAESYSVEDSLRLKANMLLANNNDQAILSALLGQG